MSAYPYADRFPVNRTLPEQGRDPGEIIDFFDRYGVKQTEIFPEIHAVDLDADKRPDLVLTSLDTAVI